MPLHTCESTRMKKANNTVLLLRKKQFYLKDSLGLQERWKFKCHHESSNVATESLVLFCPCHKDRATLWIPLHPCWNLHRSKKMGPHHTTHQSVQEPIASPSDGKVLTSHLSFLFLMYFLHFPWGLKTLVPRAEPAFLVTFQATFWVFSGLTTYFSVSSNLKCSCIQELPLPWRFSNSSSFGSRS